ncbi:hypothetical protein KY345_02990 [Candidatus Woesearchaeota archaeon]|nr:hypothetical protein [Candidatus Woesearchaeota archaeon]
MPEVVQKGNGGVTLQIKVNPKIIERSFYLTVIIVLAIFVFMGTFCDKDCEASEEETQQAGAAATGATTQETEVQEETAVNETAEEEPEVNETAEEEPVVNETVVNETVVNETEEEPVVYSGDVELVVNEVMTEIKGDTVEYGKITGVRFTISNEKDDFMPLVKVYTYEDGDTSSIFARIPREERIYSELKLGKSMTQELTVASQQFPDLDEYVICKVVVYNKATEKELASVEEKFKIT